MITSLATFDCHLRNLYLNLIVQNFRETNSRKQQATMKTSISRGLLLACLSGSALAHYKWPALIINGTVTGDYQYVRQNTNNINPLMDINSIDLRCNEGGLASGGATQTADVNAGAKVGTNSIRLPRFCL
jgi:hypothetical protein